MSQIKGMIFCAGLGTRMLPLTQEIPKALIPVLNSPNIDWILNWMFQAGISDIAINLHHLGEKVKDYLSQKKEFRFHFSHEKELLNTEGGLKRLESFLDTPFVVANCDFFPDFSLKEILHVHTQNKVWATLVLDASKKWAARYPTLNVNDKKGVFTGIQVLDPKIFSILTSDKISTMEGLYPKLFKEYPTQVSAIVLKENQWWSTGELNTFYESQWQILKYKNWDLNLIHREASVAKNAKIENAIIYKNCDISPSVVLKNTIVLASKLQKGLYENQIIWKGKELL